MAPDKIVVSHAGALKAKYGAPGLARIREALDRLVAADAKRGFATCVVFIDRANDMRPYRKPAGFPATAREAKAAVDAIYAADRPDYLVLLGAQDVVPFQLLSNPLYAKGGDDDDYRIESDLPYACDAPFGSDPNDFVGPTRVVGRLPDLVAATDPAYLLKLIRIAANAKTRKPAEYRRYFALSAQKWKASSALTATTVFGDAKSVKTSPEEGPDWTSKRLAPRVHFINCHGNKYGTVYNGQPAGRRVSYPIAHQAPWLPGKITNGAVLAAECCYGAQLYDPERTEGQEDIAYVYLEEGAYGVFGSSTISYGPYASNDSADLICQYFLAAVLHGASLGRAALEARQHFAEKWSHLNPEHQKTLAQFYLLGDPSVHPVAIEARTFNRTNVFKRAFAKTGDSGPRAAAREADARRTLDRSRAAAHQTLAPSGPRGDVRRGAQGARPIRARLRDRALPRAPLRGRPEARLAAAPHRRAPHRAPPREQRRRGARQHVRGDAHHRDRRERPPRSPAAFPQPLGFLPCPGPTHFGSWRGPSRSRPDPNLARLYRKVRFRLVAYVLLDG